MIGIELNNIAIAMGKVLVLLAEIVPKINNELDIYDHKEELCVVAYVCRKGILDRLDKYPIFASNPLTPIRIPTGIFSSKKETIEGGLNMTIGKLKEVVSSDVVTMAMVENILNGGNLYYQYERIVPEKLKNNL